MPSPGLATAASVEALKRAEQRALELAAEQAALRQIATLVARQSSFDQLLSVVADQAARVFDVPLVSLERYEQDGTVVILGGFSERPATAPHALGLPIGSWWPREGPGVTELIYQTGRPARVEDYALLDGEPAAVILRSGLRSTVASPILVDGDLWGAMVIGATRPAAFPEGTEARLTDFSELIAMAIANAESRAAVRRLVDEQSALRRVATLVARRISPDELFSAVSNEVGQLFGSDQAAVGRYERDGSGLVLVGLSDGLLPSVPIGTRWPLDAATAVYQTGRPARQDQADYETAKGPISDTLTEPHISSVVAAPIVVEDNLWGAIVVIDASERLPPDSEERVAKFTELVATAIANAESRSELAASRARIVAAGDDARRRIERDLHDGAQQQLVTLLAALRTIEARMPLGPDALRADVNHVAKGLATAVDELRELSRGIHPAVLTHGGLSPALKALKRRSAVSVMLDVRLDSRLADQVEATAYFAVAEVLTNASRHASASHVWIAAEVADGVLRVSIRDDGLGGADARRGSGLTGLKDRIEAVGGTIRVESPPGSGTTIEVRIPIVQSSDEEGRSDEGSPPAPAQ